MMGGLIAILVIGSVEVGGLDKVWQINKAYNRTTLFELLFVLLSRNEV